MNIINGTYTVEGLAPVTVPEVHTVSAIPEKVATETKSIVALQPAAEAKLQKSESSNKSLTSRIWIVFTALLAILMIRIYKFKR